MASILNRYENIMSTNVCGMIEFAEDPMKMARHLSHHMEDDLSKTKREGAELMKLHEIHEKLNDQIQQITAIRAAIYEAARKK